MVGTQDIDNVTRKLIAWKDALIDLSRRNPLLSLPIRSILRLSEDLDELWQLPASGSKRLWFLTENIPGTDQPRKLKARERAVLPPDLKILNNLRLKGQLSLNEQGVNVLFLVFGVLEWHDPRVGAPLRSPILLLPVTLERRPGNDGFILARFEEEPRINPTLRYRLAQNDISLPLPDGDPDAEDFRPSAYLAEVASAVEQKPNWRVIADECLLGRFSYLNLVMYEELEQRLDDARRHPIIAAIAGDTEVAQALPAPVVPSLDTAPPQKSFHILPADPSQERAILAVREGQNLVIQGPPGTGKTQTIANIIATCIAEGKRVLFVSEKMAALEAVYDRLNACGLADLCLEAHSHKANKHELLGQLKKVIEARVADEEIRPAEMSLLASLRDENHQAVDALHRRREPLGISIYEARGVVAALADIPDPFFALDRVETIDADGYHTLGRLADRFAAFHDLYPEADTHPWRGLKAERFSQELFAQVRDVLVDLLKATDALEERTAALWILMGLPTRDSAEFASEDTDWLSDVVSLLQEPHRPLAVWFREPDTALGELRTRAVTTQARFRRYQGDQARLRDRFSPDVFKLPHAELRQRLGGENRSVLEEAYREEWGDITDDGFARTDRAVQALVAVLTPLQQSAGRMATLCGFAAPGTLAEIRMQDRAVREVITDPRPLPTWFEPGAIATLRTRAKEIQGWHTTEATERAVLASAYTDGLYVLDLDALQTRFDNDYASFLRLIKPGWYADKRTLTAVLKPGASLEGRDLSSDLRRARTARDARRRIDSAAGTMVAAAGNHYQGTATNWSALLAALDHTEALIAALPGGIPEPLQQRVLASGAALEELRDQQGLVATHLATVETSLKEVETLIQIPGTLAQPVSQVGFGELRERLTRLRAALHDFVAARSQVRAVHRDPAAAPFAELLDGVQTAERLNLEEREIAAEGEELRGQYAHLFAGLETDWDTVLAALDYAERFRQAFARGKRVIPEGVVAAASGGANTIVVSAEGIHREIQELRHNSDRIWQEVETLFAPEFLRTPDRQPLERAPFSQQREWAEVRLGATGQMERWLDFEGLRRQCRAAGLFSFCEVMVRRHPPAEQIPLIFRRVFHQRWLDAVATESPELASLCVAEYGRRRETFEQLDRGLLRNNPGRILAKVKDVRELVHGIGTKVGEVATLHRYLSQRRPRASVRKILSEIPNILFRLKPCLMMSPLSVSLFLDPAKIQFHVVIFDEASQIFPEYALGPLLRADQAVIAGDSKQLPPTSFFKGVQEESSEEDDETAEAADAREFESILDAARVPLTETYLNWHYRSRHESLIAFSNGHFYNGNLNTFPSARMPSAVSLVHVSDSIYYGGTGNSRNNPVEAARVAELVVEQVRREPGASVGVITMSEAQQECIRAAIERTVAGDPALVKLLNEDRADGFFVKNIENVQGDERDVIFLSVGYGRWPDGKVRMLFGPINRDGGERRLNVAVTRAKERLTVVSSLLPDDITISETTPRGPRLLRDYLRFARMATGTASAGVERAERDALVESVALALEKEGHTVRRKIGVSDYQVDLAVVDPEEPDQFLLGIECDGENYRNGETTRAREWLRETVLRGLGWRLYRLWSADWVRNRSSALQQLNEAIAIARNPLPTPSAQPTVVAVSDASESAEVSPEVQTETTEVTEPASAVEQVIPVSTQPSNGLLPGLAYFEDTSGLTLAGEATTLYGGSAADADTRTQLLLKIIEVEGPLPSEVIALRLGRAAGLRQTGARVKRIAEETIGRLVENGRVERRGEFLWPRGLREVRPRVPKPGAEPRPIEHICLEEIGEVVVVLLQHAIGMQVDEAVSETARVLGYERAGTTLRERIGQAISLLEYENRVHNFNGQLRPLGE